MKIEFYEEFPNKENLKKLKLIKFPTKIFIAAKSIKEFQEFEKIAKSYKKDIEIAYWPIVKNSYWISPFSNTKDLLELFSELNKIKNPVLIDLELPRKTRKDLYLRNVFYLRKNKKLIRKFLEENKSRTTTAEYIRSPLKKSMRFCGVDFDVGTEKSLMHYTSRKPKEKIIYERKLLNSIKNKNQFSISLGLLAKGVSQSKKVLSPENLEKDLKFVQKAGFKKVVIFRLEGLNKNYMKVLARYYN